MEKAKHSEKLKSSLVSRLNRVEGQVRGISKMIQDDVYCNSVLNQIRSIDAALNGVKLELLEAHMKSCVIKKLKNKKYNIIDELVETMKRLIK